MDVSHKTFLVIGMARSGIAAAQLLAKHDARVLINDKKPLADFADGLDSLRSQLVEFHLGEDPVTLLPRADTVVISPGVPLTHPIVAAAEQAGKPLIGEMELGYLLSRGSIMAITGTNGKTTTTALTGEIFRCMGKVTHVVGNIGNPICAAAASSKPEDVLVAEVSSFQLETVRSFRPKISAILNIRPDHLDRHGSMEEYARLKARIFENQREDDVLVLNYDEPGVRALAKSALANVVFFSRTQRPPYGAWVSGGNIVFGGETFRTVCGVEEVRIAGPANLENALAAACIGISAGVPVPVVRQALRTFAGVEHRLEAVLEARGIRYINDSKGTNVDSVLKAIDAMTRPTILLLGGSDKHADFAPLAQAIRESGMIRDCVLLGQTAPQLKEALLEAGYERLHDAPGFAQAIEMARAMAVEGDNVLLSPACASFDMFTDFEHRGREFKRIVRELEEAVS